MNHPPIPPNSDIRFDPEWGCVSLEFAGGATNDKKIIAPVARCAWTDEGDKHPKSSSRWFECHGYADKWRVWGEQE